MAANGQLRGPQLSRLVALSAVIMVPAIMAQYATFTRIAVPDNTPTRVNPSVVAFPNQASGSAWFLGGRDADGNRVSSSTVFQSTSATSASVNVAAPPAGVSPLEGSTQVLVGTTGSIATMQAYDPRTFFLGGGDLAASANINVGVYDPSTATWTATLTVDGTPPPNRVGAAAAYLSKCDVTNPQSPLPCIVMFGGTGRSGLMNDAWALWTTATPRPRWQQVQLDRATPVTGQPTRRTNAAAAASSDGTTMIIFGGITGSGPTSDMFAVAPTGFPDATYNEMVNVARNYVNVRNSSWANIYSATGPLGPVDGDLNALHSTNGQRCSHSTNNLPNEWWGVELNGTFPISAIRITPRADGSFSRMRAYRMWTSTTDPNPGAWPRGGPPADGQLVGSEINGAPQIINLPVTMNLPTARQTRYFWFGLRDIGTTTDRFLTLCEVELLVKSPWAWRQLSGVTNVALGKSTRQSSYYLGAGPSENAVDGRYNNNNFGTAPSTCTHTSGNGQVTGSPVFWQVDLGNVYDVKTIRLYPRTDCCTANRLRDWSVHAGLSRNQFETDTTCYNGALRNQAGAVIVDAMTTAYTPIDCPVKARYLTVRRPNNYGTTSADNSIISICEFEAYAELMPNLPAPRRDFAFTQFRGNLIIFGGVDGSGFRQSDIRFFDLDRRVWLPAVDSLGTPLSARSFAGMAVLGPRQLLLHGGNTAGDASAEAAAISFPACPALDQFFTGVTGYICSSGGTACTYTCGTGFNDMNNGNPVVCREDGQLVGSIPPCIRTGTGALPLAPGGLAVVYNATSGVATVAWSAPSVSASLGWYGTQATPWDSALKQTRVQAKPVEFVETFAPGQFDPLAWRVWNGTTVQTNSYTEFDGGRMILSAAPQTEYWGTLVDNTTKGYGFALANIYITKSAHMMVRDWPADVNPAGDWAMETEIEALTPTTDATTFAMGLLDMGLNTPFGEHQFHLALRYTDAAGFQVQLESMGGRASRVFQAKNTNRIFLRIERVTDNAEQDYVNSKFGLYRCYYKFTAGARWVRIYDSVSYRELQGVYWNAATSTMMGPGLKPRNLRPFFLAKSTQNADYARGIAAFSYFKITQGLVQPGPGTVRMLPHPMIGGGFATNTQISGLTPGASYTISVQWQTDAGYGAAATQTIAIPDPNAGSALVAKWGDREVAYQRPAWMNSMYQTSYASYGNDGNWFTPLFHTACSTNGDFWGVDLGVDYAAVKHMVIRNRCDCASTATTNCLRMRHMSVFVGQDATGARTTNPWVPQYGLWDNFTMQEPTFGANRDSGIGNVPVRHFYAGTYNSTLNRAVSYPYTAAAWASDQQFCLYQVPTPGYGRYFYLANGQGVNACLHATEVQVWTGNTCPDRVAVGGAIVDNNGGRGCDKPNNRFGRTCAFTCPLPTVLVSGVSSVVCNGENWVGGPATPVVCGLQCTTLDMPNFASTMTHTIINEDGFNFSSIQSDVDRRNRIGSLNPIVSPFNTMWAFVDNSLQGMARRGIEKEAVAVFTVEKIRLLPRSVAWTYTAVFTANDKAGLLFRIQDNDDMNYYRAVVDPITDAHVIEAVIGGVRTTVGTANMDVNGELPITLTLDVVGAAMNMTLNGRLILQVADATFGQGYVGLFAEATASFKSVKFSRETTSCEGVTAGETCTVTCQPGLLTVGNSVRSCQSNGQWTGVAAQCTLAAPTFPPATLTVKENSPRNTLVGIPLAAQSSSSDYPVSYQIVDTFSAPAGVRLGPDLFSVDFCSGQVKVKRNGFLDYESLAAYLLQVRAYISGFPLAFTDRNVSIVVLDVDEPPTVNRTTVLIPERTASGAIVGQVQCIDPENHPVSYTLSVDGSNGRIGVDSVTGRIFVKAAPGNRTGFPSMSTGSDAPLNYELVAPWDIVVTVKQTGAAGGDPTLTGSGTVTLTVTDENDAPILYPDQSFFVPEATFAPGATAGTINTLDEDTNLPAFSFTQVDPAACGISNPRWVPNTAAPPGSVSLNIGTDNLFNVNAANGQITVARAPTQTYNTQTGGVDNWPAFLSQGRLLRAEYRVCVNVTDFMNWMVAPVTVAVVTDMSGSPALSTANPSVFPTAGNTRVYFEGNNLWPSFPGGSAPTLTASYSNGIDGYNATGCTVVNNTHAYCTTKPGVGASLEWTFILNSRLLLTANPVMSSYAAPEVTFISGHTGMPTTGSAVTLMGTNLGPLGSRKTISYGPTGTEYDCAVSTATGNSTLIVCTSSSQAGGISLGYQVVVGGQVATLTGAPATATWSYATPTVQAIASSSGSLQALTTTGGQTLVINGTNYGGATVPVVVTYGGSTGTVYTLPCVKDGATPHTKMTCTLPAGVGAGHAVMVSVAGVSLTVPFLAGGIGLSYLPPSISNVYGPGWRNGDTTGAGEISILGDNFGPASLMPRGGSSAVLTIDFVTYGPPGDTARYAATSCRIVSEGNPGLISCLSAPGVGRGLRLAMSIGGQAISNLGGLWPTSAQANTLGGAYAAPSILGFGGAGAANANTAGGDQVIITGKNFGPMNAYTSSLLSVTYGTTLQTPVKDVNGVVNVITNVTYRAVTCDITVAHTEITCTEAEGAGQLLGWDVVVAGQKSATPTTNYASPQINSIGLENAGGQAIGAANVDGGDVAIIQGTFFGPAVYASGRSLVQSISFGTLGTEYVIPASAWLLVSQNTIRVRLPAGFGSGLVFRVTVADQVSTSDPAATFSYLNPDIIFMDPYTVGTYSDPRRPTLVTVVARNLPLRDPLARLTVTLGTFNPRAVTPVLPQGAQAIAAATNGAGPFQGAINFTIGLPTHFGGQDVGVAIKISRGASTTVAATSAMSWVSALQSRQPTINDVVVSRALWSDGSNGTSNGNADAIRCPFTGAVWQCSDTGMYRLDILGSDFTSDQSDWADGIIRTIDMFVFYDAYSTPPGDVYSTGPVWRYSWTHDKITIFTKFATGRVRLNITSIGYDGQPRFQILTRAYIDQSPLISAVTGPITDIPTTGGSMNDPLVLTVEALAGASAVGVTFGKQYSGTLLEPNGPGAYRPISVPLATWLTNNNQGNVWTLYVLIPPGQGKNLPVVVNKTSGAGVQGSNTGFSISYASPVLLNVQTVIGGNAGAVTPVTPSTVVTVPTDGSSAIVRLYGRNLGISPSVTVGDGYVLTGSAVVPCTTTVPPPSDHSCYQFNAPAGEGDGTQYDEYKTTLPLGFKLKLTAGEDLSAQDSSILGFRYQVPAVTSVTSSTGAFPTEGGVDLTLTGTNFGVTRLGRVPNLNIYFGRRSETPVVWTACTNVVRVSTSTMTCTLPQGSGLSLSVNATVAGLTGVQDNVFSYDAPVITEVIVQRFNGGGGGGGGGGFGNRSWTILDELPPMAGFARSMVQGDTSGGDNLVISGYNFGTRSSKHCLFLTWANRRQNPSPPRIHTCNGGEDFLGEGEVDSQNVFSWNHSSISVRIPSGLGLKDIELSIRGRTLGIPQYDANLWRFVYSTPQLTSLRDGNPPVTNGNFPQGTITTAIDTEGGELVTLWANGGFGAAPRNMSDSSEVFSPPLSLNTASTLPMAYVAIAFHRACISDARTLFGGRPEDVNVPVNGVNQRISQCDNRVLTHNHQRLSFYTGPGIGKNRTVSVLVIDGTYIAESNKITVNYKAPEISTFAPQVVLMKGIEGLVDIKGNYFGNAEKAAEQGWTDDEKELKVAIGGYDKACKGPGVDRYGQPAADRRRQTLMASGGAPERSVTIIMCNLDQSVVPAGMRNVSLTVAGQTGRFEAFDERQSLVLACAPGYFGHVNETCIACPAQNEDPRLQGAQCDGFDMDTFNAVRKPNIVYPTFEQLFRYPRPLKGWYNLNSSDAYTAKVDGNPSMLDACPPGYQGAAGDHTRDVCIVPCDPPESCLGDNICAEGYTSKAPEWRCAYCDKGYYKRSGECIKCPDSPGALFIGFILLVIAVAVIGFALNRKQINIAVISIGVDFFQVLAIFAQARIKWPPVVKELLHVLSAFNLNIEIVAPECLIPDVSYKQKFWFIMLLPLCIAGLFGLNYAAVLAYKALIQGQPKKMWHTHKPAMVSSCLVLLYLLYLYLTRTIFDVFNCAPTYPAVKRADGTEVMYLQVVFEECGIPGGTQLTLMGYAIAGLVVYTAGYPLFIGYMIFKNREIVMEDQLLRAKGTGNDKLTNPRAYDFRSTYGRSYFQFKPDYCMWILAIILRKFFIAITAVVFGKNSSFQMAACLLIMFLAYAAQVQIRPYMSPGDFDEVLKSHTEASYSSAVHARLRASIAGIESRGRKKAHKNLINFEGKVDRTAVFGVLMGFFFNYNTVEAIMSFCAVIVCLMAIMYQANELNTYYPQSRDSVTSVVLIVIIWAIVYFFTVFITEIVVLYNEDNRSKQLAKASKKKSAGEDGKGDRDSKRNDKLVDGDGELNLGKVETATNPLFLRQDGNASAVGAGMEGANSIEAILSHSDAPPVELWRVFQQAFSDMHSANNSLKAELQKAKKQIQTGEMGAGLEDALNSSKPAAMPSRARTQFAPRSSAENTSTSAKGVSMAGIRKATKAKVVVEEE